MRSDKGFEDRSSVCSQPRARVLVWSYCYSPSNVILNEKSKTAATTLDPQNAREYKRTRNRVVALKRQLKKLYFQNSILEAEGDSGKLWKSLKRFLQNSTPNNEILAINGKETPTEKASEINNYFIEIGEKLSDNIGDSQLELDYSPDPNIPY